ncbi:MAG TPA: hypothetical protein VGF87_02920 [Acidimicrobiales bacterium]|jgi:hypothetical protein
MTFTFFVGSPSNDRSSFTGKIVKETALGRGDYCAASMGELLAAAGKGKIGSEYLNIATQVDETNGPNGPTHSAKACGWDAKLAKDILARIS